MASLLLTPREELLWLVALLDGEGSFTLNGKAPNIVLAMADEDTVRLAHARAGVGNVNGPYDRSPNKPIWQWKVTSKPDVLALCKALLPYMSERRSAAIQKLLATEKPKPTPIWVRLSDWER